MRSRSIVGSVLCLLLLAFTAEAQTPSACEHIQFRFVDRVYQPGADTVLAGPPHIYKNSANGWTYALGDTVVLDERGIASVRAQSVRFGADTSWAVMTRNTPAGARALSDATASHVGRYLGIVIGNDLVDTPRIASRLTGTVIQLRGLASRAVAESLAGLARRAIDSRCHAR
jgi:preprotein translocase subunit SecD